MVEVACLGCIEAFRNEPFNRCLVYQGEGLGFIPSSGDPRQVSQRGSGLHGPRYPGLHYLASCGLHAIGRETEGQRSLS